MAQWIVLLRGINVGAHRRLPMADLRAALEDLAARDRDDDQVFVEVLHRDIDKPAPGA